MRSEETKPNELWATCGNIGAALRTKSGTGR